MPKPIRCQVCGAEREAILTRPLPCGHHTLEDTFGPMPPVLKVRSLDEVFGADAPMVRAARDKLGEVERTLKAYAEKGKADDPDGWQAQIEGVRAEIGNPKWVPKETLGPLLKMVSAHLGLN